MDEQDIKSKIMDLVQQYYYTKHKSKPFDPGKTKINYAGRVFDELELQNLVDASLEFWLTSGKYTKQFEKKFSAFFSISHTILVNSGSSANLLALSALTSPYLGHRQLRPGDEVITTAAGFPATVTPIIQNQLVPVFIDSELGTYDIKISDLEKAISAKTKAIMIAHTLGNPINMKKIMEYAHKRDIWVIEDNCDAVGSTFDNKLTGTIGDIGTISFYPAHHMTMGEGGALITNNDLLARIIRSFRDWGRDCYCSPGRSNTCGKRFSQSFGSLPEGYDHKYVYTHLGYNLKATDLQAAIGVAQIDKLPDFIRARKENFKLLHKGLSKFSNQLILPKATDNSDPSWFGFPITISPECNIPRNELTTYLEDHKIETRNLFGGNLVRHPAFEKVTKRIIGDLKNADIIMLHSFFIGVYPGLDSEKIAYIIHIFEKFFEEKGIEIL